MALFAAIDLASNPEFSAIKSCCHFLSAGTDGQDGPTDAAGAIVTAAAVADDLNLAREYLAACDSHTFWSQFQPGALIKTGLTGTNVMDLYLVVVER